MCDETPPLLLRTQAAALLNSFGLSTTVATLATLASRGGGPPYRRHGRRVVYERDALVTWADESLSPARATATEHRHGAASRGL